MDVEKLICFKTAKDIWDKFYSIYDIDLQATCDVKRISLEDGAVKASNSITLGFNTNNKSSDHTWKYFIYNSEWVKCFYMLGCNINEKWSDHIQIGIIDILIGFLLKLNKKTLIFYL